MTEQDAPSKSASGVIRRFLPLIAIGVILAVFFASGLHTYLAPARLIELLSGLEGWIADNLALSIVIFFAVYAGAVAISFPFATGITLAGGFLFGPVLGTITVVFAATIGATIIYWLAKGALGKMLSEKAGGAIKRLEGALREDELSYMLLLRLIPLMPFFVINIAAGVLNVSLRNYVLGTFFGIIPGTAVYVSIGNGIRNGTKTLADADAGFFALFSDPAVYLPLVGLIALALMSIILKRIFGSKLNKISGDA